MRSGGSPRPLTPEQKAAWRTYHRAHALLVRQLDQDLRVAHRMTLVTYNAPCSAGWPRRPVARSGPTCMDLLANDEHGVGLVTVTARRGDQSLTVNDVNVFHLCDSKVTECWIASSDQQAEDEFWA